MKIFKDIRLYMLLLLFFVSALFSTKITIFSLPRIYYILIVLILIAIFLFMILLCYQKRKSIKILGIVLTLLFSTVIGYGSSVVNNIYDAMKTFEENAKQKSKLQYSAIIYGQKEEGNKPSLIDYENRVFAVLEMGNVSYNHEVVNMIREEIGEKIEFKSINSIEEALKGLESGDIGVLVINESIRYMLDFDLSEYTSVIKSFEFETEKNIEVNRAKVTKEPFIVYLSGQDFYGSLEYVSRSDVNKIMVVNPVTKDILLIDIPRDYYVPLTCYYNEYDKLTHSGNYGVECTVDTIENFFDISINYYARVNFSSIIEIIDALGGIDVYSDYEFSARNENWDVYHFNEGLNKLDGDAALSFARERYSFEEGDQERVKNQTRVLKAIINKILSPSILKNYSKLLDIVSSNVETNLPTEDLMALIQMQLKDNAEWSIESYTVVGEEAYAYSAMMGRELYMRLPIESSVEEAKSLINELMNREY